MFLEFCSCFFGLLKYLRTD